MSRSFGMSGLSEDSIRAPLRVWEYLLLIWHRLIVLSMLKNSPALLIKSGTAPFTFLREEAEGTETSQAIAFTLEHLSSAAPLGASVSTWFKRQWRKWECFLETSRDWHKVPRQQSTLSWFYLNSLWLGAGKTKLPFLFVHLWTRSFPNQAELPRGFMSFPDRHKAQDAYTNPWGPGIVHI